MVGIGMGFAGPSAPDPNIEDTLLFASREAMEKDDLRVLAVLVTWFGVHSAWVNADRLTRLVAKEKSPRVRALWTAFAIWQRHDRRFTRMAGIYKEARLDVLSTGTEFLIRRHGEDARFADTCLRVPANVLRDRPADVATPEELARLHTGYRCRAMIGPSYRADAWSQLETEPELSAAEVARRAYASFATAWQTKRDFSIVKRARIRRART
jgi:hypothetical protein